MADRFRTINALDRPILRHHHQHVISRPYAILDFKNLTLGSILWTNVSNFVTSVIPFQGYRDSSRYSSKRKSFPILVTERWARS